MKKYILASLTFLIMIFFFSFGRAQVPQATISWTDNSTNEDGFILERKLGPIGSTSPFVEITRLKANVNSVVDATIQANVEYCYRLSAFNASGSSQWSNTACGTSVQLVVPNIPAITLKMSSAAGIQPLTISWTAPPKPNKLDWLGLYLASSTDRQFISNRWVYTNGAPSGTWTVTPANTGTYNVRYLLDDGFVSAMKSYDVVVK